jgi:hypothetical protein
MYAKFADKFSQIIVKINHHQTQNNAHDIKVINVAGKNIIGLIAYNIIYITGHQKEVETKL